jgi:hypothetical protein
MNSSSHYFAKLYGRENWGVYSIKQASCTLPTRSSKGETCLSMRLVKSLARYCTFPCTKTTGISQQTWNEMQLGSFYNVIWFVFPPVTPISSGLIWTILLLNFILMHAMIELWLVIELLDNMACDWNYFFKVLFNLAMFYLPQFKVRTDLPEFEFFSTVPNLFSP